MDANIYGKIIDDTNISEDLSESIRRDNEFQVHNFRVVRNELRKIPELIELYDKITTNRIITVNDEIEKLASGYYSEYKKNGGVQTDNQNFMNDLLIVACASIKGFDIIVSDDEKTMKNPIAIDSYDKINLLRNLRTPTFISYKNLRHKYLS